MKKKKIKEGLYDIGTKIKVEGWKRLTTKRDILMNLTPSEREIIIEKYDKPAEKLTIIQLKKEWSAIKKAWDIS